ncbi:L-fuculokinase [Pantoea sp. BAV 3049]|uniref:FGGY-family carbohydrate kinase n=1 Tax=Pantoea sp. BAV 3049 TaxID=2654188 RepID=UPI00131A6D23|nr:FGGY family carbohydrate kinase [Pantoea sp. BAV 3049]
MYFIGIDIGTTNCKLCLFRMPSGELVSKHSFPTPKILQQEQSNFDVDLLWEGVLEGLTALAGSVDYGENIVSIAVASVGEAGVLLDGSDRPVGPAMTWYDIRTQPQLEKLLTQFDEQELYRITGIPPHSNYSLNKISWIIEHHGLPDSRVSWLCIAEYIAFRLCGVKRAEASLASRTLALDIRSASWSETILQKSKLPGDIFSPVVASGTEIGQLLPSVVSRTGLSGKVGIAVAGHDHMCGSVAAGVKDGSQILNSTGTTEGLLILLEQPELSEEFYRARLSNGLHVVPGRHTLYASLPSAGYCIEWFRKLFNVSAGAFNGLMAELDSELNDVAEFRKSMGGFIPHLRGSGPPNRSILSRAMFYGINENTDKKAILKFIFLGLCFELKNLLDTCETLTDRHFKQVKVIGSACKNPFWLRLKATVLNREVIACDIDEAVSKGAAMIAARMKGLQPAGNRDETHYLPVEELVSDCLDHFRQVYLPFYHEKIQIERQANKESV